MMKEFQLRFSGDMLDEQGHPACGYFGQDILDAAPHVRYAFLEDQAPHDPSYWDRLYSMQMEPRHIAGVNGLVIVRPYIRASTFADGAEDLVVIGRAGVGTDKIDMAACTQNDVAVFNAPESLTHSTASAAMLLMLAVARKLPAQERMARSGCWRGQGEIIGNDLVGKTIGIVGLGRISKELIRLLAPFQMHVLVWSRHCSPTEAASLGIQRAADLDALLRASDFVSLHCALTPQTRGMIGRRELRLMKPSAYFINTGRGEMVHQESLVQALQEGWIAGASLDVFESEPLPADDPLTRMENVVLTPHWLPTTHEAVKIVGTEMARGILNAARGLAPANVVNGDVLGRPGFQAKLARFQANMGCSKPIVDQIRLVQ
jgi:phosphoglycerate dehydrogenase-like enzyme